MRMGIAFSLASRLLPSGRLRDLLERHCPAGVVLGARHRQRLVDSLLRRLHERRAGDPGFVERQLDAGRARRILVVEREQNLHGRRFFIESLFGRGLQFLDSPATATERSGVDLIVTLGYSSLADNIALLDRLRDAPILCLEAAFLRSILMDKSASMFDRAICFFVDDMGHHYDPGHPSRLECLLNDPGFSPGAAEISRARALMRRIVETKLTKYNDQPTCEMSFGRPGRDKVLVIEQARNDWAIVKSAGGHDTFAAMLEKAIHDNPDADILVKIHPDTLDGRRGGVKKSYYGDRLSLPNVFKISTKANPYSLLEQCSKVYVFSSMFGFEALMAGKDVHVFGLPCYAGWGLTTDHQSCPRRRRRRTLEEVVYAIYCRYTVYVGPDGSRCEPEQAIDYLLALRDKFAAATGSSD